MNDPIPECIHLNRGIIAKTDIPMNTNLGLFQVQYNGNIIYTSLSMIEFSKNSFEANCVRRTNNLQEYYLYTISNIKKGDPLTLKW